jgi:Peptidase family S41
VYITNDLIGSQGNESSWDASAISQINGQSATDYLAQFATLNAIGGLEPNADWNQLMSSPALDIQNYFSIIEGYTTFYPGDNITFTFENGTVLGPEPWLAIYNSPGDTGPLATGGDFYNFFVLGLYPASYNPKTSSINSGSALSSSAPSDTATATAPATSSDVSFVPSATATPTSIGWNISAYPEIADVAQQHLGVTGTVTGYFLHDNSIAVLSIPSFQAYGASVTDFSNTITNFLQRSKEAGLKKVLIDLQQNLGGDTLLAFDIFKQFFPPIEPFAGSRLRAHHNADVLGNTFTTFYDTQPLDPSVYFAFSASNWVSSDLLNAETEENFTSWGEFFGPHEHNGDQFTTTQQYNLSSDIFDIEASGGIVVYGYGSRPATTPQPYAAEDIVILTDGLCSSTCALFMEAMQHDGGVRSVVVGGQPSTGPMQARSGSRGAEFYTIDDLDPDFQVAGQINATAGALLPPRTEDVWIHYMGINIKDQIGEGEDTPLHFLYSAADCRIFSTPETFWNFTNLWKYAASAIWANSELCVADSTGHGSSSRNITKPTSAPPSASPNINSNMTYNISGIIKASDAQNGFPASFAGQQTDVVRSTFAKTGQLCGASAKNNAGCPGGGFQCISVPSCGSTANRCVKTCSTYNNACGGFRCNFIRKQSQTFKGFTKEIQTGFCPLLGTDCGASVTGPDAFSPTTAPSVPKQGSSDRSKSSPKENWLSVGSMGGFVKAGLALWG